MKQTIKFIFTKYFLIASLGFASFLSLANEVVKTVDANKQTSFQPTTEVSSSKTLQAFESVWQVFGSKGAGSGFFIDSNRFVTALHVIEQDIQNKILDKVSLETHKYAGFKPGTNTLSGYNASGERDFDLRPPEYRIVAQKTIKIKKVLALSVEKDLALLETEESVSDYLPLREQALDSSEQLAVLGYPDGKGRTVLSVSQINDIDDNRLYFNVDYSTIRGASGGAVIDNQGHVIALLSQGIHNTIHATGLKSFIHEIDKFSCENKSAKACFEESLKLLHQRAEKGHVSAQYELGMLYFNGYLLKKTKQQAEKWLSLAAEQGHPVAQYELGTTYIEQDNKKAVHWFEKAGGSGYAPALHVLGMMREDFGYREEALSLFQRMITVGYTAPAFYELGVIKMKEEKWEEALSLFQRAMGEGFESAKQKYGISLLALAKIKMKEDQWEEALSLFQRIENVGSKVALTLALPFYVPALLELAKAREEQGKLSAFRLLQKATVFQDIVNSKATEIANLMQELYKAPFSPHELKSMTAKNELYRINKKITKDMKTVLRLVREKEEQGELEEAVTLLQGLTRAETIINEGTSSIAKLLTQLSNIPVPPEKIPQPQIDFLLVQYDLQRINKKIAESTEPTHSEDEGICENIFRKPNYH